MKRAGLTLVAVVLFSSTLAMAGTCPGIRIEGTITAIDAAAQQIVIGDTVVQVTAGTIIKMGNRPLTFADLQVGMTVAACGTLDADGVLQATRINVRYHGG